MEEKFKQAKKVDREALIDTFNNLTFDYEGNTMVVRDINVELMRPADIVQNAFKVVSAIDPMQHN